MQKSKQITDKLNSLGKRGEPFVFLIDFEGNTPLIFALDETEKILWQTPENSNYKNETPPKKITEWKTYPVSFKKYKKGFQVIQNHIHNGDIYLLNFTQPTKIETNLNLEDIFGLSSASYKILLKDNFVCFSPETFVRIIDGKISSYPMKGTIDAGIENAEELILTDSKELAEHNTIIDLIRNDLSLIAENVRVEKFRIYTMLPAGSISGAPKNKTVEIIQKTEKYTRGFYTGIFCYFDGKNLDSCVLIRYLENDNGKLIYKSGGGITFMSNAESEYDELIKKVYVPIA